MQLSAAAGYVRAGQVLLHYVQQAALPTMFSQHKQPCVHNAAVYTVHACRHAVPCPRPPCCALSVHCIDHG